LHVFAQHRVLRQLPALRPWSPRLRLLLRTVRPVLAAAGVTVAVKFPADRPWRPAQLGTDRPHRPSGPAQIGDLDPLVH
jgi:hypothetical protein